jgi:DNA end-binding protein Ku
MAGRPRWKGTLTLGLVSVPVHLWATAEKKSQTPVGHNVHRKCQTQAESKKWCTACDIEIPDDELMRGYDAPGGKFVELSDAELDSLKVESTKAIVIRQVSDASELEPLMIADTMFLVSDGTAVAAEAEAVLIAALDGKIAIGSIVLSQRERPVAVMVYKSGFVLHVLRTSDAMKELPARAPLPRPDSQMVALAMQLVDSMSSPLDLAATRDSYAEGMKALVQSKVDGLPVVEVAAPAAPKVMSLMDALRASMTVLPSRTAAPAAPVAVEKPKRKKTA